MRAISERNDVELMLMQQGMPRDEIRAALRADDPRTLHRYLELHRERLQERLDAERLAVDLVERILVGELGLPGGWSELSRRS